MTPPWLGRHGATGRSPGSKVLMHRLPGRFADTAWGGTTGPASGRDSVWRWNPTMHPHFPTVAGAAGAWRRRAAYPVPISPDALQLRAPVALIRPKASGREFLKAWFWFSFAIYSGSGAFRPGADLLCRNSLRQPRTQPLRQSAPPIRERMMISASRRQAWVSKGAKSKRCSAW